MDRHRPDLVVLALMLNVGGAERHMLRIIEAAKASRREVVVLTLIPGGVLEKPLEGLGIERIDIGKTGAFGTIKAVVGLVRFVFTHRPRVVYSVLSLPNVFSGILKLFSRSSRVYWGIRSSGLSHTSFSLKDWIVAILERSLSKTADGIIYNSSKGLAYFAGKGFSNERSIVVRNGIDTSRFIFDPERGQKVKGVFGIPKGARVIGTIGRAEFNKGPDIFLRTCERIFTQYCDVWVLVVGRDWNNLLKDLRYGSGPLNLDRLCLVGEVLDVRDYYSAMDIFISASRNEGTQNSLLEAMSCERVCVVTDVGDSKNVVDNPFLVSADISIENLSNCVKNALELSNNERAVLGRSARERVIKQFSMEQEYKKLSQLFFETN